MPAPDHGFGERSDGELVSEARGKLILGLLSLGVGLIGVGFAVFLWHDDIGTIRMLGSYSRSLAALGGASSLFSGYSLLQETRPTLRLRRTFGRIDPTMLVILASVSLIAVVVALVTYSAVITINFL